MANESGLQALGDRMDDHPASPRPAAANGAVATDPERPAAAEESAPRNGQTDLEDPAATHRVAPASNPTHNGRPPSAASGTARHPGGVANEVGLLALGDRMRTLEDGPVANQAGLLALGDEMQRQRLNGVAPDAAVTEPEGLDGGDVAPKVEGFEDRPEQKGRRHRHARPRSKTRTWVRRGLIGGLTLLLLVVVGGGGYLYYLTHDLNRIHVRGLQGALTSGKEAGTENILMVGSTSRCALKVQNPAYGLCSQGVNGVNSDVIMILHVDPNTHHLALLSIPRDLFLPNARAEGANKIDAGLFEGVSQVVASIEEDFGIPIQHAVTLNFDQFANVVDALGGINMSFPMSVFDAESGLNVQAATCVHLNGTQALAVVRARHLQYRTASTVSADAFYWPHENLSDLARIRRDHEFLRVLGSSVAKKGLSNPITDLDLINSLKADLTFDDNWPVTDMAGLVVDFHSVDPNSVPQLTLPVSVVVDPQGSGGGLLYRSPGGTYHNYGDSEFPYQSADEAAVQQVLGIDAGTDSMTGKPLPAPSSVTVSVVNGSGVTNQAATTSGALTALGFRATGVTDQAPAGDVTETVVYYGSRSEPTEAAAEAVARSMTGAVIMAYDPTRVVDGAQVTVVTGTNFAVNPPAAPPTTTVHGAAGTTPTTQPPATTAPTAPAAASTTSSSGAVQTPSAPSTALEPWDPRACPAGAVPTAPIANLT